MNKESTNLINMLTSRLSHLEVNIKEIPVSSIPYSRSIKKECFNNCYRYLMDTYQSGSTYILGYVLIHGVPIEHAWVKTADGYYDVTLSQPNLVYIAVTEVSLDLLTHFVSEKGHSPDLCELNRFQGRKKSH